MTQALLPFVISAAAGFGTLMLGLILADLVTRQTDRFQIELGAEPAQRDKTARVIRAIGTAFSGIAAPFASLARDLDRQLTFAGRPYGGVDGQQYLAAVMVLSLLIGSAVGAFFAINGVVRGAGPALVLAAALRWWLFGAVFLAIFLVMDLRQSAQTNADEIEREFPFFLDLAVLVVQAGGTPRKALAKYVEASPGTPLAREIAITAKDADSTSFDDALHRMIERVRPVSVKTILKNLAQGERSSGEAEAFYTAQADELRHLREEMASRTAERLKTNIILPVFLMLMSIILAALAPTIVSIRGQGFF